MNFPRIIPSFLERPIHHEGMVIIEDFQVSIGPLEEKQLEALVRHVASDIQAQMIRSFRDPKTGRTYKYRGRNYRASAPGEPPAIRSGGLLRATSRGLSFPSKTEAQLSIETPRSYEVFLELGTSRMGARPFVFPAINEVLEKLQQSDVIESFTAVDRLDVAA